MRVAIAISLNHDTLKKGNLFNLLFYLPGLSVSKISHSSVVILTVLENQIAHAKAFVHCTYEVPYKFWVQVLHTTGYHGPCVLYKSW